jgi:hypothetical protein
MKKYTVSLLFLIFVLGPVSAYAHGGGSWGHPGGGHWGHPGMGHARIGHWHGGRWIAGGAALGAIGVASCWRPGPYGQWYWVCGDDGD